MHRSKRGEGDWSRRRIQKIRTKSMLLNKGRHIKGKTVLTVVTIVNNPYTIFVLTVLNSLLFFFYIS